MASVDDLRWQLDAKVWSNYGTPLHVSPSEVRRDPQRFATHYERAMAADLSYPLYVTRWNGRLTILDGMHRLLKADILGYKQVPVYVIGLKEIAEIMVPPPEEALTLLKAFFDENEVPADDA
jgi:hypothetical protein